MTERAGWPVRVLVPGEAAGRVLRLDQPLSLWGGLDAKTGEVIDRRHPQSGAIVTQRILVMPSGRGSSSASSILLESVRRRTAPAAIVLAEVDGILALGATVAREIYGHAPPVVVAAAAIYERLIDGLTLRLVDGGSYLLCGGVGATCEVERATGAAGRIEDLGVGDAGLGPQPSRPPSDG